MNILLKYKRNYISLILLGLVNSLSYGITVTNKNKNSIYLTIPTADSVYFSEIADRFELSPRDLKKELENPNVDIYIKKNFLIYWLASIKDFRLNNGYFEDEKGEFESFMSSYSGRFLFDWTHHPAISRVLPPNGTAVFELDKNAIDPITVEFKSSSRNLPYTGATSVNIINNNNCHITIENNGFMRGLYARLSTACNYYE